MREKKYLSKLILPMLFVFFAVWGCRSVPVSTVNMTEPVCDDLLSGINAELSEYEVCRIFDEATKEGRIETCFMPGVRKCLDMGWSIPHRHVKQALKIFNRAQHREYFNKAFVRYFNAMIFKDNENEVQYRDADRDFLIAYIRAGLKTCENRDCYQLISAKQICSRLDPELYKKFFK